ESRATTAHENPPEFPPSEIDSYDFPLPDSRVSSSCNRQPNRSGGELAAVARAAEQRRQHRDRPAGEMEPNRERRLAFAAAWAGRRDTGRLGRSNLSDQRQGRR